MLKVKYITLLLMFFSLGSFAQQKPTPQWRPQYHFSSPSNWINDPNGLLYANGLYHLYYQYNPFENKWGHMSWGHAVSKDLVNWQTLPVAIPELITKDTTTMIFSGSGVWDKNNTSGFGKGKGPIVAIYTAHLPRQHKEAQYIAYSNDEGKTFTNYAKNPVIDISSADFRDPNVFWSEKTGQWIMTVSTVKNHKISFYGSKDLKEWTKLSDFGMQGWIKNDWECPFIVPLPVDGNTGHVKWLLMISSGGPKGPLMQYFVGDFDGRVFKNDNPEDKVLTADHGDSFYAAIPWNNAPGNRRILLGWLQPGNKETYPWKGQMSIPRDLSLRTTPEGIRLFQSPSAVVSGNLNRLSDGRHLHKKNLLLNNRTIALNTTAKFSANANWIEAELVIKDAVTCGFKIAQLKDDSGAIIKEIEAGYNSSTHQLYIDCTRSEKGVKNDRNLIQSTPLLPVAGKIKIQVLMDGSSLEVFGNDGEKVITTMVFPGKDAIGFSAFSNGGNAELNNLNVWDLSRKKP